jgi:hypothetical protein
LRNKSNKRDCRNQWNIKGIGSISFLKKKKIKKIKKIKKKKAWKKIAEKNDWHHLRSNNYEVCTAVALCFPNIIGVIVLENVNLSEDKNRATSSVV